MKILFGGTQKSDKDLVAILEEVGHRVAYVDNGKDMFGELERCQLKRELQGFASIGTEYDLVIYDTNLFYPEAEDKQVTFAEKVVSYLQKADAPVIVLDDHVKDVRDICVETKRFSHVWKDHAAETLLECVALLDYGGK
ncbi:hypothetical protein H6503_03820 [Candidatus Woesearchaeota archaeon]|nr:hypothetical protein [Candidatus Woesearchaeota archaeon]